MQARMDFLNCLEPDMSTKVLLCLEDPSDLLSASSVSHSWRDFVIGNSLSKAMCLKMFPQLSEVDHVTEPSDIIVGMATEVGSSNSKEWETLVREHRVYACFCRSYMNFNVKECIGEAIVASSTDNFPEESIYNTLEPRDRIGGRASYWSSKGHKNTAVPETLLYKLVADLCVITEINIQPFQAYFQPGEPIYSATSLRFRMGYAKSGMNDCVSDSGLMSIDDKFVWTYTSQEFPMAQENSLQKFRLPEPILCIGGYVLIELLGRVQTQEMDSLYYLCMSHVQVIGKSFARVFGVDILEPEGKFILKALSYQTPAATEEDPDVVTREYLQRRVRNLEQLVNILRGNVVNVVEYEWDNEEEEDGEGEAAEDEEFVLPDDE